ncbi:MAG TPA: cyclic pyranopterin monophosphate synthase MoaC [Brevundimonas sp.]|uniref:cyclic pyranopterin monophosphate synthase MoaC n=1 Tax=Brevundimonas sp. TaxID=1871086 RepID=UPI002BB143C5|nr:cyclic pyranopterin monophosphate synthase MoaC [Brevundimonas sp.]HRH20096.1 cyclic pyranopterin monophosphate synthase MoaC [Brevundimonas sp.]
MSLTHLDQEGRVRMVDVGDKAPSRRIAVAEGQVDCAPETVALVLAGEAAKGAVIATAEVAGVMGAKRTSDLIPLCHPLGLESVTVRITPRTEGAGFYIRAEARLTGTTGVEMEALTAVSIACLTLYDMLKAADKGMVIRDIRLLSKTGGKSGDWTAGT